PFPRFLLSEVSALLGRQTRRLHLMKQPPNPTIRHCRDHHAGRLATAAQPSSQRRPPLIAANQSMGRFHQQGAQLAVAGFDQPRIGLFLAAGGVAGTDATETAQLLARAKAVESADLRAES